MEISLQAGELVGVLYDAPLKRYKDPEAAHTLKSLNALCVRPVFCLAEEDIEIPRLDDEVIDLILSKASEDFNRSSISPTVFGAVFASTLNPGTRRSGEMHYTNPQGL